ncbi:hypothetical protein RRF74_24235, partial [Escherichia coli]|uniref:hypothetical protein n=1 Tax=Escherichia coli TaxID=562 RepID=UPI0028DA9733
CYGIKIDHAERETTGVEGKAERLTWHKAWTAVSSGFSISYTSREKRTAPCRNSPLTKDTKSCFVIKPPVYLSVLFCVFFSSAFLSNAIYSGKTWNGIKGKTGRPPFSTSFIADNMRSDILFLAIESGVTVSGCPTT